MHETKGNGITKQKQVNTTPNGFEYHWPLESYDKVNEFTNWFINFKTNDIYVAGSREVYKYTLEEELTIILFGIGAIKIPRSFHKEMKDAYINYLVENVLLE